MSLSVPAKKPVFCSTGNKNTIPATTAGIAAPFNASYDVGIPAIDMTPASAGGLNPDGKDFNGVLFDITTAIQYQQAGGGFIYDAAFSVSIGGYPLGAIVQASDGSGFWVNETAGNTNDPEAFGTGWLPLYQCGASNISMSSANVTLTALQSGKSMIFITGALSASLNLIFPTWNKAWLVVNNSTGAYSITAKTTSGSGVILQAGVNNLYGDGTNIDSSQAVPTGMIVDQAGLTPPPGYLACPTSSSPVSRATYAALFSIIGTAYGAGDGSTTFDLPIYPIGYASVAGGPGTIGSATVGTVLNHTHGLAGGLNFMTSAGSIYFGSTAGNMGEAAATGIQSPSGGSFNAAAGVYVKKCIKY